MPNSLPKIPFIQQIRAGTHHPLPLRIVVGAMPLCSPRTLVRSSIPYPEFTVYKKPQEAIAA
ncbi:hypothetical protein V2H45_09665 [Tumidithrix elongata RA019]|uniref:Uncharacterized protein n=1 Tax=Tumidithrix elongata BACA0141 TaxID=2716417 RepID=A0AAW9PW13_9CYAN|nr:hypothetical protein [Tumidithrix elongata RA019]